MRFSFTILAAAATGAYTQSAAYTDANTGITFEGYEDTTGFKFGMALPTTPGSDFIGQMIYPSNGTGYGGITLTGEMVGSLLVLAWPSDGSVIASFRETSGYTSPAVYTNDSLSLSPIANGTFINSTHVSYTFLCEGCIMGTSLSFASSVDSVTIGWAFSDTAVTNAASASGSSFSYHNSGYGDFGLTLAGGESADYASYAAMASNTSSSSNSTCTSTGSNVTATISNATCDYIVAGGGPAGIITAERLAESGKSVLLIEGGPASSYASGGQSVVAWNDTVTQYDVPSMSYYLTTSSIDTSEYCTNTADMAGCLLGGGTMVNALMFVRPQDADFNDKWPTGWKWDDVSASAAKLYERNPGTTLASADGKRYDQSAWNVMSSFLSGMGWTQTDAIEDPNAKTAVYSYPPWDIQDGLRAGSVKSYLPLANALSNFKLTLNTKVIRAVRNGSAISGVEVEAKDGSQIIKLNSGGGVILAAGTLSTPAILLNSGIGPTEQITTVANGCVSVTLPDQVDWIDLPVGENLRDHPIFTLTFNEAGNVTSMLAADFTSPNETDIDLFAQESGPLAQSGQRLAFWTSLNSTNGTTNFFQGTSSSSSAGTVRIKLYLTHGATSVGSIGINSQGATEYITKPWMTTAADQAAITTMINTIYDAANNGSIVTPTSGTAASMISGATYTQGDHFVGTAMMGATNDGTAVVDTDTKVFGTDNLFVVDGSIHPDLPTGNSQAIIMVAAEHAATKILALGSGSNSTSTASGDDDECDSE